MTTSLQHRRAPGHVRRRRHPPSRTKWMLTRMESIWLSHTAAHLLDMTAGPSSPDHGIRDLARSEVETSLDHPDELRSDASLAEDSGSLMAGKHSPNPRTRPHDRDRDRTRSDPPEEPRHLSSAPWRTRSPRPPTHPPPTRSTSSCGAPQRRSDNRLLRPKKLSV